MRLAVILAHKLCFEAACAKVSRRRKASFGPNRRTSPALQRIYSAPSRVGGQRSGERRFPPRRFPVHRPVPALHPGDRYTCLRA